MAKFLMLALAVALALTGVVASAQNQITLNGTASGNIVFTGTGGGNLSMSLGSCSLGANCITGAATGTGSLASTGIYDISGGPLTLVAAGANTWDSSGLLNFSYQNGGTNLLSGTLNLVNFTQVASLGVFNDTLLANLTNLSGTLAGNFSNAAIADLTIVIQHGVNLSTLGNGVSTTANISSGEIFPTPEPGSMLLFGSGLVALGGFLRGRRGVSS